MTNSDLIRDLLRKTSVLEERAENTRLEIKRLESDQMKSSDWLIALDRRLAVLDENVKDLKKIVEERERRRFTIFLSVLGCVLTLVVNLALTYFRLPK